MPYKGPIEDRLAIRELQELYGDAIIRKDKQDWLALWDDNATWVVSGINFTGKASIAEKWDDFYTSYNQERGNITRFYSSTPGSIEIHDNKAASRIFVSVFMIFYMGVEKTYYFICTEDYAKHDGSWRITKRDTKRLHPPIV